MSKPPKSPHVVDVHVGRRLRIRRKQRGVSQGALAGRVGLTFQQMQKYERAGNRISASKLYEMACVLEVPLSYFFQGLPEPGVDGADAADAPSVLGDRLMTVDGGAEIAEAFHRIQSPKLRRAITAMICAMAESNDQD